MRSIIVASLLLALIAVSADPAPGDPSVSFEQGIESTQRRLTRGEYLVEGILWCFQCHSEPDTTSAGQPPKTGRAGVGRVFSEGDGKRLVAPNLTPDRDTGIGRLSDAQLARAIRQGIGHDGRRLRAMPSGSFSALSDEDLASVIVYLRSRKAVRNRLPQSVPVAKRDAELARQPLIAVRERDLDSPLERGRYLVELADCMGCHTAWEAPRMPGALAGGNEMNRAPGTYSTNITADRTGIGYGAEAFVEVMRSGKSGALHAVMPWAAFRNLTKDDLVAIYVALKSLPPVQHLVVNAATPTLCEVCGQRHGGGENNALLIPEPAASPEPALLDSYAGEYVNARFGMSITIVRESDTLKGQAGPWRFTLVPQTDKLFLAPGFIAPIRFESTGHGPAERLVLIALRDIPFERSDATAMRADPAPRSGETSH